MALLQDFEPPSPQGQEKHNLKQEKKDKYYLHLKDRLFLATSKCGNVLPSLNNFFVSSREFVQSGKYLPHIALIVLALIVSITNLSQKIAARAYSNEIVTTNPGVEFAVAQSIDQFTPLISNDPETTQKAIVAQVNSDGFISNTGSVATEVTVREEPSVLPSNEVKTIEYVVNNGDTLSGLGMKFDLKLATLKYVNNIDNENSLKPGMKLKIPPKNYEVPASLIAKKEKEKQKKLAQSRNTVARDRSKASGSAQSVRQDPGSRANGYPYGWCTYFVATRRYVPTGWGNAKNWLSSARRAGYATGSEPAVGAIVVTSESGWGHVAYVEDVDGGNITISEMNYLGWGVVSRRTISADAGVVRGFVY